MTILDNLDGGDYILLEPNGIELRPYGEIGLAGLAVRDEIVASYTSARAHQVLGSAFADLHGCLDASL